MEWGRARLGQIRARQGKTGHLECIDGVKLADMVQGRVGQGRAGLGRGGPERQDP